MFVLKMINFVAFGVMSQGRGQWLARGAHCRFKVGLTGLKTLLDR